MLFDIHVSFLCKYKAYHFTWYAIWISNQFDVSLIENNNSVQKVLSSDYSLNKFAKGHKVLC